MARKKSSRPLREHKGIRKLSEDEYAPVSFSITPHLRIDGDDFYASINRKYPEDGSLGTEFVFNERGELVSASVYEKFEGAAYEGFEDDFMTTVEESIVCSVKENNFLTNVKESIVRSVDEDKCGTLDGILTNYLGDVPKTDDS
ncbi:hypothetical protein HQ545_03330 [Candidatus Woesearchaeota archaeon]|nr:hypothetical protein [Candidatus Woesearchaeota archaeon]